MIAPQTTHLIRYELRLGDILRCLPYAEALAKTGNVKFLCRAEYHGIFDCVDYADPVSRYIIDGSTKVHDLQIWPDRYDEYRSCDTRWQEFVFGKVIKPTEYDLIPTLKVNPLSRDYGLPENFCLVSPYSVSGESKSISVKTDLPVLTLSAPGQGGNLHADNLSDLVALIARATEFITVNSAPAVIAAAVRDSYQHISCSQFGGQDDYRTENQIRL